MFIAILTLVTILDENSVGVIHRCYSPNKIKIVDDQTDVSAVKRVTIEMKNTIDQGDFGRIRW